MIETFFLFLCCKCGTPGYILYTYPW